MEYWNNFVDGCQQHPERFIFLTVRLLVLLFVLLAVIGYLMRGIYWVFHPFSPRRRYRSRRSW